ncbi:hypothetical protein NDU88_006996 [Pleurodeles waltl]|uniref:Uncharacterized protein n=1 Tax=Pleurodeles waltl TaxID=8319 RepID=A0AAV7LS98_PLEWA|nr:hypothetical protein NDU88_006996 [Pleurodeles waltl]
MGTKEVITMESCIWTSSTLVLVHEPIHGYQGDQGHGVLHLDQLYPRLVQGPTRGCQGGRQQHGVPPVVQPYPPSWSKGLPAAAKEGSSSMESRPWSSSTPCTGPRDYPRLPRRAAAAWSHARGPALPPVLVQETTLGFQGGQQHGVLPVIQLYPLSWSKGLPVAAKEGGSIMGSHLWSSSTPCPGPRPTHGCQGGRQQHGVTPVVQLYPLSWSKAYPWLPRRAAAAWSHARSPALPPVLVQGLPVAAKEGGSSMESRP